MGFWNFLTLHKQWNIRRTDVVLDIGSGNNPILRADILVDRFTRTDAERSSGIIIDRPFINADAQWLPFKDKSVDFIYCSHLLEHIPEPALFFFGAGTSGQAGSNHNAPGRF